MLNNKFRNKTEQIEFLKQAMLATDFNVSEIVKIHKEVVAKQALDTAKKLLEWISNNWKEPYISLEDVRRTNICTLKGKSTKKVIFQICDILEYQGYLKWMEYQMVEINGHLVQYAWKILKINEK